MSPSPKKKQLYADAAQAVQAFLRAELDARYQPRNVRRFSQFGKLDPALAAAFRDFALARVYPSGRDRAEIDAAFAALHEILHSPKKMASLGSMVLSLVWRLGRRLPATLAAGQQVIHAFSCASAVESALADALVEHGIPWKHGVAPETMQRVFDSLPDEPFEALIEALIHLLQTAANRDTMETGLGLLDAIAETMKRKPAQWTEADRRGVDIARNTLKDGLALLDQLDETDVPLFIRGIEALERDWYQSLRSGSQS